MTGVNDRLSGGENAASGDDLLALAFLDEDNEANVFALPRGLELDGLVGRERLRTDSVSCADLMQFTNDCGMVQIFAGVFSAFDVGVQTCFGNGNPDLGRVVGRRIWERGDADVQELISVGLGRTGDYADIRFLPGGGAFDGFDGLLSSAADEFIVTINDHLRSVGVARCDGAGVDALTEGGGVGRERIGPAAVIPIIDVLFEGNDFDVFEGLLRFEFGEKRVGRRATGTAFGGKEFDDDGSAGRLRDAGCADRGAPAEKQQRGGNSRKD
jgi:hypothetical protein